MGLLDSLLKSESELLEERQSKFNKLDSAFSELDSAYQELEEKYPRGIPDDIKQGQQALRIILDQGRKKLEKNIKATPKTRGVLSFVKEEGKKTIEDPARISRAAGRAAETVSDITPDFIKDYYKTAFGKGIVEPAMTLAGGFEQAAAGTARTLDSWASWLSSKTGIPKDGILGEDALKVAENEFVAQSQVFMKHGMNPEDSWAASLLFHTYSGIGRAAFNLPMIMRLGLPTYSAMGGGANAIEQSENVLKGTVVGGIEGLLLHGVLKSARYLPQPEKMLFGAGIFGSPAAVHEMAKDPKDRDYSYIVAELVIGGGLLMRKSPGISRKQLAKDLRNRFGKDFEQLTQMFGKMADDKMLDAFARGRGASIANIASTPEGAALIRDMGPFETFEAARWRHLHERINKRGVDDVLKREVEAGRAEAERIAQRDARQFMAKMAGRKIEERVKSKEEKERAEKYLSDLEKRAEFDEAYLIQVGKENARMNELDDMNIALMQKHQAFYNKMEEILKRAAIPKKVYEGAPQLVKPGKPEFLSEELGVERPTGEVLERTRQIEEIMVRVNQVKKQYEGPVPIIGEGGKIAGEIRGDKEVAPEKISEVKPETDKDKGGEDIQRIEETKRAKPAPVKTELVEEALKVARESKGSLNADETMTGRGYQLGVKARKDKKLAERIERGIEEVSDYVKATEGEESMEASQAKQYWTEAKQAAETTGGFKLGVEKGEIDTETGKEIPRAERKPKEVEKPEESAETIEERIKRRSAKIVYHAGDMMEYTGGQDKINGVIHYEVIYREGTKKGEKMMITEPPKDIEKPTEKPAEPENVYFKMPIKDVLEQAKSGVEGAQDALVQRVTEGAINAGKTIEEFEKEIQKLDYSDIFPKTFKRQGFKNIYEYAQSLTGEKVTKPAEPEKPIRSGHEGGYIYEKVGDKWKQIEKDGIPVDIEITDEISIKNIEKDIRDVRTRPEIEAEVKEIKEAAVGKPEIDTKLVTSFRDAAARLTKQIETKESPAVADQRPTARRAGQVESSLAEAERLKVLQAKLEGLADAHESGTVPESLIGIKSKAQIEQLLNRKKIQQEINNHRVQDLLDASKGKSGTAADRKILSQAPSATDHTKRLTRDVADAAERLMKKVGPDRWIKDDLLEYRRMYNAGIRSQNQYDQARSDLLALGKQDVGEAPEKIRIRQLENELLGTKIPGYFPTPKALSERIIGEADIKKGDFVIDPSAGKGNILDALKEKFPDHPSHGSAAIEIIPTLYNILKAKGHNLIGRDFFETEAKPDKIVMNPPFEKGQDIDHVKKAYDMLNPGGRIVAVMSEASFFRSEKKYSDFREWLDEAGGSSEKLPEKSFATKEAERQTGTAARIVIIDKPGKAKTPEKGETVFNKIHVDVGEFDTAIERMTIDELRAGHKEMSEHNREGRLTDRISAVYVQVKRNLRPEMEKVIKQENYEDVTTEELDNILGGAANSALAYGEKSAIGGIRYDLAELKKAKEELDKGKIEPEPTSTEPKKEWKEIKVTELPAKRYIIDKEPGSGKAADIGLMHNAVRPKSTTLEVLKDTIVLPDGRMYTTDLENFIVSEPLEGMKPGAYRYINKKFDKLTDDISEYPTLPTFDKEKARIEIKFPFNPLQRALKSASTDALRPALQQIVFERKGDNIIITSTDGHRLSTSEVKGAKITGDFERFYLNPVAVKTLLKDKSLKNLNIRIMEEKDRPNWIEITTPEYRIISKEVTDGYPDWQKVIPEISERNYILDRDELSAAIKELKPYANKNNYQMQMEKISDTKMRLRVSDEEVTTFKYADVSFSETAGGKNPSSDYTLMMPVRGASGETVNMPAFNLNYLQDLIGGIKSNKIQWAITDKANKIVDSPMIFTGEGVNFTVPKKPKEPTKPDRFFRDSKGSVVASSNRDSDNLELTTKKTSSAYPDSDLSKPITLRQIGERLARDIKYEETKDVRFGLIKRFSRKAKGLFFPDSGIIRLRTVKDVGVFAHEIGHLLDKHIFGIEDKFRYDKQDFVINSSFGIKDKERREKRLAKLKEKYGEELVDSLYERYELRQELKKFLFGISYPDKKYSEAIAEFVKYYVKDPKYVRSRLPKFHNLFESILDEQPNYRRALLTAREGYDSYEKQSPLTKMKASISREGKHNKAIQAIKSFKDGFYVNFIDAMAPIEAIDRELLKRDPSISIVKRPYIQALSALGVDGKAEQFLNFRPFLKEGDDIKFSNIRPLIGNRNEKGIIYDVITKGLIDDFEGYLVANRNVVLHKRGLPDAATERSSESRKAIEEAETRWPWFKGLANELQDYQDAVLKYYLKSGKLSQEQYTNIKELNPFYVPFQRYFTEYESTGKLPGVSRYLKDSSPSPVKRIKGSPREVISPLGSIIRNTYDIISAADKNDALNSIVSALETIDKRLVQDIPKGMVKPVMVFPKGEGEEMELRFTVTYDKPKNSEIVSVWRDGEVQYKQIPKKYYDALFYNQQPLGTFVKILAIPARVLRAGAVIFDPTFAVRNVPRDQLSGWFYSRYNYNPFHFVRGIAEFSGKSELYQKFLASGADQSFLTMIDKEMSKGYIEKKAGKKIQTKWQEYKSNPWVFLADINRASEMGTRMGSFRNAYLKTGDVYKAMEEARQISADYGIKGRWMRNVAAIYPFLNARTQHAKMMNKSAIRRGAGSFIAKGMPLVAASTMQWLINNSDDRIRLLYNELPPWRRIGMFNFHIPFTDSFWSIPKGPLGLMFGATTEYALDKMAGYDAELVGNIAEEFFKDYLPMSNWTDLVPQAGRPLVEQYANTVGYTGRPIVRESLKGLEPAQQYEDWTSEIIKSLGGAMDIPPVRLQHLFVAYTAGTGRYVLNISDDLLEVAGLTEPSGEDFFTKLSRWPITKAFVSTPVLGTRGRSVQKFYETLDRIETVNRTVNKFLKDESILKADTYLKDDDNDKAYRYYANPENRRSISRFREVLRTAKFLRREILDGDYKNKKEKMLTLDEVITKTAIRFNNAYRDNRTFTVDQIMGDIFSFGREVKAGERQVSRQFKQEFNSPEQLKSAMTRLHLYKLRKRAGTLPAIDKYRMEALDRKLKRYNEQTQ